MYDMSLVDLVSRAKEYFYILLYASLCLKLEKGNPIYAL